MMFSLNPSGLDWVYAYYASLGRICHQRQRDFLRFFSVVSFDSGKADVRGMDVAGKVNRKESHWHSFDWVATITVSF